MDGPRGRLFLRGLRVRKGTIRLTGQAMKKCAEANKLCVSCRRSCKQPQQVVIASCPRYYPGPRLKRCTWTQMEIPF